jgi:NAD+ diphosphatase
LETQAFKGRGLSGLQRLSSLRKMQLETGRSRIKGVLMMNAFLNSPVQGNVYWFICDGNNRIVIAKEPTVNMVPAVDWAIVEPLWDSRPLALGQIDGMPCYAASLAKNTSLPEQFVAVELRTLYSRLPAAFFALAQKAVHLIYWDRRSRFCGLCGAKTHDKADECAKVCEKCGELYYPRIAPAIIVAVIKDRQILLAHSNRFTTNFYSVLAGFVEPGESLEECVRREVLEEVGIQIKNLRYFDSQPWPFPDSLMVGFIADYAAGKIMVDLTENRDADWFSPDSLPPIPGHISIARRLIDWFVGEYGVT